MFTCPACSKANNIYATSCQHCGGPLTPGPMAGTGPAPAPQPALPPCAKCAGARLLVISPFYLVDHYADRLHAMPVLLRKNQSLDTESAGRFRAQVCLTCGFTEWYAIDLAGLTALAAKTPSAQLIEATVPPAYR